MMAFQLHQVTANLGDAEILHGIDLNVRSGHWTCFVGPNGAGKSTLLRAMAGLLPCEGKWTFLGRERSVWSARERAQHLAWLGQNESVSDDLCVWDVVMLGRLPHRDWWSAPSARDQAAVEQALRQTHTWDWRMRNMSQLSGGERQRVLLARVLAVQAPVLLMDEPLVNLDPPHQVDWLETVRGLVQAGSTVVSVLHEVSLALQADDLVVMTHGRVVHHGSADAVQTHRAVEQVFDHRVTIQPIDGHWVALPRLRSHANVQLNDSQKHE